MDLILHIGSAKCGSSAIQDFLARNCKKLIKHRIGVINDDFEIQSHSPGKRIQLNLGPYFRLKSDGFEQNVKDIIKDAKNKRLNRLILSAEWLSRPKNLKPGIHEILKSHFDCVRVIYYIRRQDEIFLSFWQQSVFYLGLSYHEAFDSGKIQSHFDFEQAADFFENIYGQDQLILRPVNRSLLRKGNIKEDFCHRLGIDRNGLSLSDSSENRSINPYLCDIISRGAIDLKVYDLAKFKNKLKKLASDSSILFKKSNSFLSSDHRNSILKLYEDSNRRLHAKHFSDLSFEDVFGEVEPSPPSEDELEELKNISALLMHMLLTLKSKTPSQKKVAK